MQIERTTSIRNTQNFWKKTLPPHLREKQLEKRGVYPPYSIMIANLDDERYKRALYLLKKGVDFKCIKKIIELEPPKYKQAINLTKNGVFDQNLPSIANLETDSFQKALNYKSLGLNSDCMGLFAELTEEELDIAKKLMKENEYPPHIAGNLAKLSEEQRQTATELLPYANINIACEIAKLESAQQEKCKKYLEQGVEEDYVVEISELNEDAEERLQEIFSLNIGDINVTDFANMSEEEYIRAKELLAQDVNPNAIYDIILIERGKAEEENEDYNMYRSRGYSYSTSASLSALTVSQIEALEKLIELHPEIRDFFKEEYEVSVIQFQTDNIQEAILTRNMRTQDGTKITLVRTFDGYGDKTQSRLETYKNNSTSSYMKNRTGTYHAKYDKYGQIKELTEFVQDEKTNEVIGVIHTKASQLLTGAYESTYYDIGDFKIKNSGTPDEKIENCVLSEGTPISSVIQNKDGSITYTEDFEIYDYIIQRKYTEKRDENNKLKYSDYSYKITSTETDEILMDISRSFEKGNDNTTTNTINGIEYKIKYDDENKKVTITDNKKTKELYFYTKLPVFSQDVIWNIIKELQVDSLLTVDKYIKKWHYCEENNSLIDEYNKILSSGQNIGIITHEIGHMKAHQKTSIFRNKELIQAHGEEMDKFKINMPFNEQEFVQYFSQRADLQETDGLSEFIAETNAILTSYGINYNGLNTRAQFLAKYFPRSIMKVAELLGHTSRKSLL